MPSVMADRVRVVELVFTVITAGHWVLSRMWLVIGTFRLLASLWTLSDSHRMSSNGRRWERAHTALGGDVCTPDVRISVERGAYLPACPSVARGYSYPVCECRGGCPGLAVVQRSSAPGSNRQAASGSGAVAGTARTAGVGGRGANSLRARSKSASSLSLTTSGRSSINICPASGTSTNSAAETAAAMAAEW